MEVPDAYATVRNSDNKVLGVVGNRYTFYPKHGL